MYTGKTDTDASRLSQKGDLEENLILNASDTIAAGQFPKELRRSIFRNPDWRFLSILAICFIFVGGITYILSMRELSETTTQLEIVQIQDRYARLVLNVPAKEIKKAKALESAPVKEKKEEPVKKIEEKKEEPAPPEPVIPDVEIKVETKYDIKKEALELDAEEERKIDIPPPPVIDVPDINMDTLSRYSERESKLDVDVDLDKRVDKGLASVAPDISAPSLDRYKVRERAMDLDIADKEKTAINVNQQLPDVTNISKGRYGTTSKKSPGAGSFDLSERERPSVKVASNLPDIGKQPERKYGQVKRSNIKEDSDISMRDSKTRDRPLVAAPEIPSVQPTVSGKKYSGTATRGDASASSALSARPPEVSPTGESKTIRKRKATIVLPETAGIQNLSACVDSTQETRLKRKILAAVDYEGLYCEDARGKYEFINIEMISTMDIRFMSKNSDLYNRCEALVMALQCITDKHKR